MPFPIEYIAQLVDLILNQTISGKIAKTIFSAMFETGKAPAVLVKELGLEQIQDEAVIKAAAEKVLAENQKQLEQYKAGKTQLFGFFVGNTMKALNGKGNPELINKILTSLLSLS